jgi:hypothetical protein
LLLLLLLLLLRLLKYELYFKINNLSFNGSEVF